MADAFQADYEVGYRKPPKERRFKKGQSGNPKGRKKARRDHDTELSIGEHLHNLMEERIAITQGGAERMIPMREAIARRLMQRAVSGDLKAFQMMLPLLEQGRQRAESKLERWNLDELAKDPQAALRAYQQMIGVR